jgi:flagellar biosynthesis GTPase FlhF
MEKKLVLQREFLTLGASFGAGCHSFTTLSEVLMAAKKRRKAAKKKAAKRKVTKRKATKRKSTKRKAAKRKTTRRKAAKKKKTTRRKTAKKRPKKRKAAKRKTTKRKAAKKRPKKKATRRKAAKKRPKRKAAKRKVAKKKKRVKRKPSAAFMRPVQPDAALAAVVGSTPIPRTQITKKLWTYIKRRGLQDSKNRRMINADDNLRRVFNGRSQVSMFEMTKLVSRHVS